MRFFCLLLAGGLIWCGCAGNRRPPPSRLIVTPGGSLAGSVVSVSPARYVVLRFPIGELPAVGTRLNAYRHGLRVAELKVTGPPRDNYTVGDILVGECQPEDEVRSD